MENIIYHAAQPLPRPIINLLLARLATQIARKRPTIFSRIDGHHNKVFKIDPRNLPFVLILKPIPDAPELVAYRRHNAPKAHATISGSFLRLLGLIDGRYDGDALFFTRDLSVEGDTEAVVSLRNALDDIDGSIADDVAECFGVIGRTSLELARRMSEHVHRA